MAGWVGTTWLALWKERGRTQQAEKCSSGKQKGTLQAFAVNAFPSCLLGQIGLIFLFLRKRIVVEKL